MPEATKRTLEITVPAAEVEQETGRVLEKIRRRARFPGFRPGKAPDSMIRSRYAEEIRQEVLESLIPKHFSKRAEDLGLRVVGRPEVSQVHLVKGEPLRFTAEFEVAPEFELGDYIGLRVYYSEPSITDQDVEDRLQLLRDQKAEYINEEPRPAVEGDYVAIALESIGGVTGPPIKQDETLVLLGGEDTLPGFHQNLLGMSPGEEKQFDVTYPEDFSQPRLAGKTVRFQAEVKAIRRKELPEVNDEFARDLGDYQNLEELREALRKALFREREYLAQHEAKQQLLAQLVDQHDFPVPETYIERQLEAEAEDYLRTLAASGVDIESVRIDWPKFRQSRRDKAVRDVKGALLIQRIADREAIEPTRDEVDREVQRIARQEREMVAAVRMRLEKDGGLARIAHRIRTEKTLSFLFDQARKEAKD